MSTYWAILEKMRGSQLRLTKLDDDIYDHLQKDFPDFKPTDKIDEDDMKSKTGKERWRKFMMAYEKTVADFNFGTLLRKDAGDEYGQDETIFGADRPPHSPPTVDPPQVPRMQFYAVEIARYS